VRISFPPSARCSVPFSLSTTTSPIALRPLSFVSEVLSSLLGSCDSRLLSFPLGWRPVSPPPTPGKGSHAVYTSSPCGRRSIFFSGSLIPPNNPFGLRALPVALPPSCANHHTPTFPPLPPFPLPCEFSSFFAPSTVKNAGKVLTFSPFSGNEEHSLSEMN